MSTTTHGQTRARRAARAALALAMTAATLHLGTSAAQADPIDEWDYEAYDCLENRFNPLDQDGRRTGQDPVPGTEEWAAFDDSHVVCTDQRDSDRNAFPVPDSGRSAAMYGTDVYRVPADHDGVRFHFEQFDVQTATPVSSFEAYRPCTNEPGDCPDLPEGLERFDGPRPVVILMHGVIAQDIHHRFNTQVFAENGYLAIGVDGYGAGYVAGLAGPNVQRCDNGSDLLDWLASDASGVWGELADLDRVAMVGHSQGSGCALGYQGDPRVHTIIAWDGGDAIAETNCVDDAPCQPVMFQRTDGGFSTPSSYASGYPAARDRGQAAYDDSVERGMDLLHITMRDTVHTDWNGRGTGLAGNRLFEQASNHYNVAWLDRHLKGRLVLDADGAVVTTAGRTEAEERAFRQEQALDAFERLTALRFAEGTNDKHNISMGFHDPDLSEEQGQPLYGGNVPYAIEGTWTIERLSPFYRNHCSLSVPDYVGGADGTPGSATIARADVGPEGDMRWEGCTVTQAPAVAAGTSATTTTTTVSAVTDTGTGGGASVLDGWLRLLIG